METGNGGFQSALQKRKTIDPAHFSDQIRVQKPVFRDVNVKSGSQKHMIGNSLAAVTQMQSDLLTLTTNRLDRAPEVDSHGLQPVYQPARTSGTS
jgi:hypothetical protein